MSTTMRVTAREKPAGGRRSRFGSNRERGAATVEYLGVLLILGAAFAATALFSGLSGDGFLVQTVRYGVCKGLSTAVAKLGVEVDTPCQAPESRKLPRCVTYQQDRLLGVNGAFRFVRGEINGKDRILTYVDPATGDEKALVFLSNEGGVGVEAARKKALKKAGPELQASAKAMADAGTGVVYEFDSRKEAQDFLDQRRGNIFTRAAGVLTGGKADALFDGIRHLLGDEDAPEPTGVTVDLGLQGEGGVSGEQNLGRVGIKGKLQAKGRAGGRYRQNFDGTSRLTVRFEGELTGEAGLTSKTKLPVLGDLNLTPGGSINGAVGYRVKFDKNGEPIQFQLRSETGHGTHVKGGSEGGEGKGSDGKLTRHTYTLDLTDPENKAAFDKAFPLGGRGPMSPVALLGNESLTKQLAKNGIEMEQKYDTKGDQLSAKAPDNTSGGGIKIGGVGIGWNNDKASRHLVSARMRLPGEGWHKLSQCTGK